MRHILYVFLTIMIMSGSLRAQSNYVANTANSLNPSNANTFVGPSAGSSTTFGDANTFLGNSSGFSNTTGRVNTFVGNNAGYSNKSGSSNTMLGGVAGFSNTTGTDNTYVGYNAGRLGTTGVGNTFVGSGAGLASLGSYNVFIGVTAGTNNTEGTSNLFLGAQAGANNTTGSYNLFMGNASGGGNTIGAGNTAIGDGSSLHLTTGQRNTAIGQYSGFDNQTGNDNVFIGFAAKAGTVNPTNLSNAIAIGANTIVNQSNSMVLGNGVNVGIGTSAPSAKLELVSNTPGESGLRLTNLASTTATVLNQTRFLTINAQGDVVLGSLNGSGRIGSQTDGLWQVSGSNLQNTNTGSLLIGPGISKTPAGYRLYVAEGILTEKVKVAVKSTSDWSDKVFETDYKLKSLKEVEQYINKTGHLPGVPSAVEVVEQGVDVARMDAKLLEKIEELTLYSIQLEKDNREHQQKLKEQQQLNQYQAQELQAIKAKQAQLEQLVNTLISAKRK